MKCPTCWNTIFLTNCVPWQSVEAQNVSRGSWQRTHDRYNLPPLQTAFYPRPPTSKIQIATHCKNQAFRTILWSLWIWMWGHTCIKKLEKCGQDKGRRYLEISSQVTGLYAASQGEVEATSRQTWDCREAEIGYVLKPNAYTFHIGFPKTEQFRNGEINGYRMPPSQTVDPCPWNAPCSSAQAIGRQERVQRGCTHLYRVVWPNGQRAIDKSEPWLYRAFTVSGTCWL